MDPLVTVVLTSYNREEMLKTAIDSVLKQSYQNWELFIMDDNSKQPVIDVIKSYLHDRRIHYYQSNVKNEERYKTTRYATLINVALANSSGKFITYLTDDTYYLPMRLESMVEFLKVNRGCHIVYSGQKVIHIDEAGEIYKEEVRNPTRVLKRASYIVDHCSVMHTRSILNKVFNKYGTYWDDDRKHWFHGDAFFWDRLSNFAAFYPINQLLDVTFVAPNSFQGLHQYIPWDLPAGTFVKGTDGNYYVLEMTTKHLLYKETMDFLKLTEQSFVPVSDPLLFSYPLSGKISLEALEKGVLPTGTIVRDSRQGNLYYIEKGKKRKIESDTTANKWGITNRTIIDLSEKLINKIPNGPNFPSGLTNERPLPEGYLFHVNGRCFVVYNGKLSFVPQKIKKKLLYNERPAAEIGWQELDKLPRGKDLKWNN